MTDIPTNVVLVGREQELQKLTTILQSSLEAKGNTVFISGEAGAGKTSLANAFLDRAKESGFLVMSGRCMSNAAVPYYPFFEAFTEYFMEKEKWLKNTEQVEKIGNLMGPQQFCRLGEQQILTPQAWKDQTFEAVINTLTFVSEKKPIVLFIDDIQWADSASLSLIHSIGRITSSKRLVLLATYRSDELNYDVEGRPSQLLDTLRLMSREGLYFELKAKALDLNNIEKIVQNTLHGQVSSQLAEVLTKESQGNPLFVVESLRMLSEDKSIVLRDGQWQLIIDSICIPNKIRDIILRRLGWLNRDQKRLIDVASVIGERFSVDILASVIEQDTLQVYDSLSSITQATSLASPENDYYKFDHAKTREIIYSNIAEPLKKIYHKKIADKLEQSLYEKKVSFNDLAFHYTKANSIENAVKYSMLAGEDALSRWSNQEAITNFKFALDNLSKIQGTDEQLKVVKENLGDAYYANCNFEDAYNIFSDLAETVIGKLKLRAYRKAIDAIFRKGEYKRLVELIEKAKVYTGSDRIETARILWDKARAEAFARQNDASLRDHLEALRIFEEEYSLPDMAQLLSGTASTMTEHGEHEKAIGLGLRSIFLFQELGNLDGELNATNITTVAINFAGLTKEGKERWSVLIKLAEKLGHYGYLTFGMSAIGNLLEDEEKYEEAIAANFKALEYAKKTDNTLWLPNCYAGLSRRYARLGKIVEADYWFKELEKNSLLPGWTNWHISMCNLLISIAKKQWTEADEEMPKIIDQLKLRTDPIIWENRMRNHYAWGLKLQGRNAEAEEQCQIICNNKLAVEKRYGQAIIQVSVNAKRLVEVGEQIEIRLDVVNVGRSPAVNVTVFEIPIGDFSVISLTPNCYIDGGNLKIRFDVVNPFQVKVAKILAKAITSGSQTLRPKGEYKNEIDETKTLDIQPITISVQPQNKEQAFNKKTPPPEVISTKSPTKEATPKTFKVFIAYKISSGKDYAEHLKSGLEELGFHTFLDSKDIPKMTGNQEKWDQIRDNALLESPIFMLLMTPGFELSYELVKELNMARKAGDKKFIFFRVRSMGRKFSIKLDDEVFETGKQEQVSFETKEELLRLAHNILLSEPLKPKNA
jgi:tetratricopeptide (TPR) repeat protein